MLLRRCSALSVFWLAAAVCVQARAQVASTATTPAPPSQAPANVTPLPAAEPARYQLQSWAQAKHWLSANQPALLQQRAALVQAEAGVQRALGRLLPHFEIGVGSDYSLVRPSFAAVDRAAQHEFFDERSLVPSGTAALSITWSLADLSALDGAQTEVRAQTHGLAATRHALIGALAATVLGVVGAERIADKNLAGLQAAQERMRLTQRLAALGRATALDVLRFSQDLSEAQSSAVDANEAVAQARDALGTALGLGDAVGIGQGFDPQSLLSPQTSGCLPLSRVRDREDQQAARAHTSAAQRSERAAELAYLPSLRLGSQYVASYAPTSAVTFDGRRGLLHNWNATANLVWTVFDGGGRAADVSQARAELVSARAQQRAARIAAATEVRRARRLRSVTYANLAIARQSLAAAREADRLSRRAFELGKASALEVVDAARRLRATEITAAAREVDFLAAQVSAQLALSTCR